MPLWINNPVLIDNEEAQNYILDEDVANFISTTGTINSLVEASKIKATARFYKSGRFSPKVYSSGWKGGSRARIKTYKITSLAEKFSSKILIVGVLFDYGRAYYGQISCESYRELSRICSGILYRRMDRFDNRIGILGIGFIRSL